jgi:hypothetical protein
MRRTNWKTISTLVTAATLIGCSDRGVMEPAAAPVAPTSAALAPADRPQLALNGDNAASSADFTVGASGGVFFVGNHAIVFPAGSICDPRTSSYGPGTWDSPCDALTSSIAIHATINTTTRGTSIDFSPALRFVPSSNPSRWVWLFMYTPKAVGQSDLSSFNILYAPSLGATPVDETTTDATLRTYVDSRSGISSRRIKHFSGYINGSGRACDPAVDADCHPDDGGNGVGGP